jgi:hypothetical protein
LHPADTELTIASSTIAQGFQHPWALNTLTATRTNALPAAPPASSTTITSDGLQTRHLQEGYDAKALSSHIQKDGVFTPRAPPATRTKCIVMMPRAGRPTPNSTTIMPTVNR